MSTALSKAEQNALAVSYEVLGAHVELDLNFVKQYLVRGSADKVSDQEVVLFMNTCKMQCLNPLAQGEVYLIKFGNDPAQMVVGKDAYLRRAYSNPNYLCKREGITVLRGNQVIQKEGCCLYPGEQLLGGWCRVTYLRRDKEYTAFKEVAFGEYNKGQASWKTKPASMIMKVAVSQCVRDAFPKDYEGLYSEEEMVASGAIPAVDVEYTDIPSHGKVVAEDDPIITNDQRQKLFRAAKDHFGENATEVVKRIINGMGFTSTTDLKVSDFEKAMSELQAIIENVDAEGLGNVDTGEPEEGNQV